jgi:hypothetical protein
MRRSPWLLIVAVLLSACHTGTSSSPPTAAPSVQHLYVGNGTASGGIAQYTLPLAIGATPNSTITSSNTVALAVDANGNLAAGDSAGNLTYFPAPLSSASVPTASFGNGAFRSVGQVAFSPSGDLYSGTLRANVLKFSQPFSNSSVASLVITSAALVSAVGVQFDSSSNLYVANAGPAGSSLFVYTPPYNGAPFVTSVINNVAYRKIAISGTRLFVASSAPGSGKIDAYALPISPVSVPIFSITNGIANPEAVALDSTGNLYVANLANATVTMYVPPFTAASSPVMTLNAPATNWALFGIAIGP